MKHKKRWSDENVIAWADLFTAKRTTLMEMEIMIGVSHSTIWWCFTHRLPHIDMDRFDKVLECLTVNTRIRSHKEECYD